VKIKLLFVLIGVLFGLSLAQVNNTPKKRLLSPAKVSGFVGGESHDSYAIHVRQGQTLVVQLAWAPEGNNRAWLTVSRLVHFLNAEPVNFGRFSSDHTVWTGKVPKTGDHYLYVVAHPTANYTLRVKVQ
jgi:hypothetical protein